MQTTWLNNQGENGRGVQNGFFDIFCFIKIVLQFSTTLNPSQAVESELQENCSLQFVWASVIGAIFQEIFAVRILVALTPPPSPFSCWRWGWSLRRARGLWGSMQPLRRWIFADQAYVSCILLHPGAIFVMTFDRRGDERGSSSRRGPEAPPRSLSATTRPSSPFTLLRRPKSCRRRQCAQQW